MPSLRFESEVFGSVGESIMVFPPFVKVQIPVPTIGTFAFNSVVVLQIVWSMPAFAVGAASTHTSTSSERVQ